MKCDLCGRTTYVYTGMLNPWFECPSCRAQYCANCSGGNFEGNTYLSDQDAYRLSKLKVCPRCQNPLSKVAG